MSRIVVANFYPVTPAEHGGQRRIFYLARELARDHQVTMVTLTRGHQIHDFKVAPNLTELQVPAEREYVDRERAMHQSVPMTADIAYAVNWKACGLYQAILAEQMRNCHLAVSEHPYSFYALRDAMDPRRPVPLIYNSQNVEAKQKLPVVEGRDDLLQAVRGVERAAIEGSAAVLACSDNDRQIFVSEYAAPADKVTIVGNGVDCRSVIAVPADQRRAFRQRLGLGDRFTAIFGGSFHFPNLAAAKAIVGFARTLPDCVFLFLGSICQSPELTKDLPANVIPLGTIPEAEKWIAFGISDVALNPMSQGSGSNIKMFEYAAAGLPAISTRFGARGTDMTEGTHYIAAELDGFTAALQSTAARDPAELARIGAAARDYVARTADWSVIGLEYRALVKRVLRDAA